VKEHRAALVTAALTLVQAWVVAGKPRFVKGRIGSFEEWSAMMGGILETAGIDGMLGNVSTMNEDADAESRMFEHFVRCWWDAYRDRTQVASDLQDLCQQLELLEDRIADATEIGRTRRLGKLLSLCKDRVFLHYKIKADGYDRKGRAQYRLEDMSGESKPLPKPAPDDGVGVHESWGKYLKPSFHETKSDTEFEDDPFQQ
jgi:hypothetical protein